MPVALDTLKMLQTSVVVGPVKLDFTKRQMTCSTPSSTTGASTTKKDPTSMLSFMWATRRAGSAKCGTASALHWVSSSMVMVVVVGVLLLLDDEKR